MAFDAHKNLAIGTVATPPAPPGIGLSLTVATGEGTRFPVPPFQATVWPSAAIPTPANAEIVRVTGVNGDVITLGARAQEGTVARAIAVGDLIAATITAKSLTDVETEFAAYARLTAANTFTEPQTFRDSGGVVRLKLNDLSQPVDTRRIELQNYGQRLHLSAINDAETQGAEMLALDRIGNTFIVKDLYEKQRTTPMGHWIDIPFNAANFSTPTAGATWTVTSQVTFAYTLIGKTVSLLLYVAHPAATITGAPVRLYVTLPAVITPGRSVGTPYSYSGASGATSGTGVAFMNGGSVIIDLLRDVAGTTFPAGGVYLYLTLTYSIS
jgi:hypothetical protein